MIATSSEKRKAAEHLILFVTGQSPRSVRARMNLAKALARLGYKDLPTVEVDLLEEPRKAVEYDIFATPALVKPGSSTVIYGDLSEEKKLMDYLGGVLPLQKK